MVLELVAVGLACLLIGGLLNQYLFKGREPKTAEEQLMEIPSLLEETGYSLRVAPTPTGDKNILGFITQRKHNVHDPKSGENRTKLFLKKIPSGDETWEWEDIYNHVDGKFIPGTVADGQVYVSMMQTFNQDDNLNNMAWRLASPRMVNHFEQKARNAEGIYAALNRTKNDYKSLYQEYQAAKGDRQRLSEEVRAVNTENDKLNRMISNLSSENKRLKEELHAADVKLRERDKLIEEFQGMEGVEDITPIRPAIDRAKQERVERARRRKEEEAKLREAGEPTEETEIPGEQ